jgi:hypothetical protein
MILSYFHQPPIFITYIPENRINVVSHLVRSLQVDIFQQIPHQTSVYIPFPAIPVTLLANHIFWNVTRYSLTTQNHDLNYVNNIKLQQIIWATKNMGSVRKLYRNNDLSFFFLPK